MDMFLSPCLCQLDFSSCSRIEIAVYLQALVQMCDLYTRFPTILQACESVIEMLRGQYAHSTACYSEAAFHYIEAAKVNYFIFHSSLVPSACS